MVTGGDLIHIKGAVALPREEPQGGGTQSALRNQRLSFELQEAGQIHLVFRGFGSVKLVQRRLPGLPFPEAASESA